MNISFDIAIPLPEIYRTEDAPVCKMAYVHGHSLQQCLNKKFKQQCFSKITTCFNVADWNFYCILFITRPLTLGSFPSLYVCMFLSNMKNQNHMPTLEDIVSP